LVNEEWSPPIKIRPWPGSICLLSGGKADLEVLLVAVGWGKKASNGARLSSIFENQDLTVEVRWVGLSQLELKLATLIPFSLSLSLRSHTSNPHFTATTLSVQWDAMAGNAPSIPYRSILLLHIFNFQNQISKSKQGSNQIHWVSVFWVQFVGAAVYAFLVVCYYTFLGLFLGNRTAELTLTLAFSVVVRRFLFSVSTLFGFCDTARVFAQATSVMFLFVRCTAIDPTDRTSIRKRKKTRGTSNATLKLNYSFILWQIVIRFLRRVERKLLRTFIKRKYLDPLKTSPQMEPLLPFPLVMKDDDAAIAPNLKEDDISFCALCDFEVLRSIWLVGWTFQQECVVEKIRKLN